QLWTLYADGVREFKDNQWITHPIPEVRAENRTNPLRNVRPIPLLPTDRDHLLILLSDRLLEYDAAANRTLVLKQSSQTRLENFTDLTAARDGGAWICGSKGLARLAAPLRQVSPESVWREFPADDSLQVQNLQRPFEDDDGGVTMVGESIGQKNRGKRVVVY